LVSVNLIDENVDPKLKEVLASKGPDIPNAQNAYFSMVALTAPSGENIHSTGIRVINEHRKNVDEKSAAERPTLEGLLGSDTLEFVGALDEACYPEEALPCYRFCCVSRPALTKLIDANQELLRRYQTLYAYPYYRDFSEAIFAPSDILKIHRLKLARVTALALDGETTTAIQAIQRDLGFWRNILTSEINAILYSLTGVAISNNLNLLSEILLTTQLTDTDRQLLADTLSPLTTAEKAIDRVMSAELRQLDKLNRRLDDSYDELAPGIESSALQKVAVQIFYRPNATLNFAYAQFARVVRDRGSLPQPPDSRFWKPDRERWAFEYLYNPIGKLVTDWVTRYPFVLDSGLRADSRYRLVALQLKLLDSKTPESEVDEFIATASPYFSNPFTGEKIEWDGKEKRLLIRVPDFKYTDEIWVEYCEPHAQPDTTEQAEHASRLGNCA
jgi:hypothetical protein